MLSEGWSLHFVRGHAFMQNVRCGHYELGVNARAHRRVANAFTELARTI
jgi:transposase, IS6 family